MLIRPARPTGSIQHREIQLVIVSAKVGEQVKHLVQRARGFGVRLVHLVQHHDRPQPQRQRLRGHEFCLRHRPFGRIHQQHNPVHHRQDPLHLAAEIGVTGGIDDVDPRALPFQRGTFGQDRDPAFAFNVIAVHRPFGNGLIVAERSRLFQQFVH